MSKQEQLERPSIEQQKVVAVALAEEPSWLDPYVAFLSNGSLPKNGKEAEMVQRTSTCF